MIVQCSEPAQSSSTTVAVQCKIKNLKPSSFMCPKPSTLALPTVNYAQALVAQWRSLYSSHRMEILRRIRRIWRRIGMGRQGNRINYFIG